MLSFAYLIYSAFYGIMSFLKGSIHMKKLICLILTICTAVIFTACSGDTDGTTASLPESSGAQTSSTQSSGTADNSSAEASSSQPSSAPSSSQPSSSQAAAPQSSVPKQPVTGSAEPASMADALFIGDSRTVGISLYAKLDADFFAATSLNTSTALSKSVEVEGFGSTTLENLLKNRKYGKIYIMLGINEIGSKPETLLERYKKVVSLVRSLQPDAALFIMGNMHVSASHRIDNGAINTFNALCAELADNKQIFYIDINTVFDDANGALASSRTSDGVHLYSKDYAEWGRWIAEQTSLLLGK